jgi:hypothetical protein
LDGCALRIVWARGDGEVSALLVDAVVREGRIHITDAFYRTRADRFAKKLGDGVALRIRIEPEDEAWRHSDGKHLYGHLYKPVSKRHGEPVAEVHLRMKSQFMPEDGRTSITELNRDEFKSFIESVEQDIRENDPESWEDCVAAMSLYEQRQPARRMA